MTMIKNNKLKLVLLALVFGVSLAGCGQVQQASIDHAFNADMTQAAEEWVVYQAEQRRTQMAGTATSVADATQMAINAAATSQEWQKVQWTVEAQSAKATGTAIAQNEINQQAATRSALDAQRKEQEMAILAGQATGTAESAYAVATSTQVALVAGATSTAAANAMWLQATQQSIQSGLTAQATIDASQAALAANAADRDTKWSFWTAVFQIFGVPAGIILLIMSAQWLIKFLADHRTIRRDDRGVLPGVFHAGQVINSDVNPLPAYDPKNPRLLPAALQAASMDAYLKILLARVATDPTVRSSESLLEQLLAQRPAPALPEPAPEIEFPNILRLPDQEAAADWSLFANHTGVELPVGVKLDGSLMLAHPEVDPHRTVAGKTGGGKSRYGMRPAVAAALARGFYVVSYGELAPTDFPVFDQFPNYRSLTVEDPADLLPHLKSAVGEIKRRSEAMMGKATRWGDFLQGGPRIMMVFDEFADVGMTLEGADRKAWFELIAKIARTGRKFGVHLLLGAQNPTAESVRPGIRRNTLLQSFKMADPAASQAVGIPSSKNNGGGAERLKGAQFLAVLQSVGIIPGLAFAPSDDDIGEYLTDANIEPMECPQFIEAKYRDADDEEETIVSISVGPEYKAEVIELAEAIRPAWESGLRSKNGLARTIGKTNSGATFSHRLDLAIEYLTGSSSTSSMA